MTAPKTLLRLGALQSLAAAASLAGSNPVFAPLVGAQVILGQAFPSQSVEPGAPPMPNQLLIYIFEEDSKGLAEQTTAPQFETTAMLVVEGRVETRTPELKSTLPDMPPADTLASTIDGQLEALTAAVKEAVGSGVLLFANQLNGSPLVQGIGKIQCQAKITGDGQRILGHDVVTFDLIYGESFNFATVLATPSLTDLSILTGVQAVAQANAGNTGNGTIGAITAANGAQPGDYEIVFTSATAFAVANPDSTSAGSGTIGTAFTGGGLSFTITAGSHAFIAGDGFAIAVTAVTQTTLNPST